MSGFIKFLRRLRRDHRGVSAIEFAMLAPVLIAFYLGLAEMSQGLMAQRRVEHTASAICDLTAQARSLKTADLTDTFLVGKLILSPFQTTTLSQRLSSVTVSSTGVAKVDWSQGSNMSARGVGSTVSLPANVVTNGQSVIMSEVSYVYTSPVNYILKSPITFTQTYYLRPRVVDQIPLS
ncbi:MAG: pilus assembly protein [Proteobacteria bacterium]|nr:pilus assembly protein [Pseudomonadota bacterium]